MQRLPGRHNPKRRLLEAGPDDLERLRRLAGTARYGGNPEHKRNPRDFGLHPPVSPRPAKSLCDVAEVFKREEAESLLREGLRRGLVSQQERTGWPQNVWAVAPNGVPLEAQLENAEQGSYHGYPMPESDPLADEIVRRWSAPERGRR